MGGWRGEGGLAGADTQAVARGCDGLDGIDTSGRLGGRGGNGESLRYRGRGQTRFTTFGEGCDGRHERRTKEKWGYPVCHLRRFPEGRRQSRSGRGDRGPGGSEGLRDEPYAHGDSRLRRRFCHTGVVDDRRGSGAARTVRGEREKGAGALQRAKHIFKRAGGSGECGGRDSRARERGAGESSERTWIPGIFRREPRTTAQARRACWPPRKRLCAPATDRGEQSVSYCSRARRRGSTVRLPT